MRPKDTSEDAHQIQLNLIRKMTGSQRIDLMVKMCAQMKEVTKSGIRSRHPEYDEDQVHLAYARLVLGKELFEEVFPGANIKP